MENNSITTSNNKPTIEATLKSLDFNQTDSKTAKNKTESQNIMATSPARIYHKTRDSTNHDTDNLTNQSKLIYNTHLTNHSSDGLPTRNQSGSLNKKYATNQNTSSPMINQLKSLNDSVVPLKMVPQLHSLQLKNDKIQLSLNSPGTNIQTIENNSKKQTKQVENNNKTNSSIHLNSSNTTSKGKPATMTSQYGHTRNQDNFIQNQQQKENKESKTIESKPTKSLSKTPARTSPYYPTLDFLQKQYLEQKFNQMSGKDKQNTANDISIESKINQPDSFLANQFPQIANQNQGLSTLLKDSISNQSSHAGVAHMINPANEIQQSINTTTAPSQTPRKIQSDHTTADHVSQTTNQNQEELSTTAAPFELVINVQNDKVNVGRKGGGGTTNKGGVRISWVKESESPDQNIVQFESVRKKNIITDQASTSEQNQTTKNGFSSGHQHKQALPAQRESASPSMKPLQKPSRPIGSNKRKSRDPNNQSDVSSSKAWTVYPSNPDANGLNLSVLSTQGKKPEKTSSLGSNKNKMNSKRLSYSTPRDSKHIKIANQNKVSNTLGTTSPITTTPNTHWNQQNNKDQNTRTTNSVNESNIARNLLDQPELKRLMHEVLTNRDQDFKKVNKLVGRLQQIVQKGLHSENLMEHQVGEISGLMHRDQMDKQDNSHTLSSALTTLTGLVGLVKRVEQQQRKSKITPVMKKDFEELQGKLDKVIITNLLLPIAF